MKHFIKFIIFLTYTVAIFFMSNPYLLGIIAIINITMMCATKLSFLEAGKNLLNISPFILLAMGINWWILNGLEAILVGVRLILVCNITYTFSKMMSTIELAKAIEILLSPLKLIKINVKDIGIMICIAVSFIPILKDEVKQTTLSLKAKGTKLTVKNSMLVLKTVFISILKRTNQIELSIREKAYE